MSCMFCEHYAGIGYYCLSATLVLTGSESFNCEDYKVKEEVGEND